MVPVFRSHTSTDPLMHPKTSVDPPFANRAPKSQFAPCSSGSLDEYTCSTLPFWSSWLMLTRCARPPSCAASACVSLGLISREHLPVQGNATGTRSEERKNTHTNPPSITTDPKKVRRYSHLGFQECICPERSVRDLAVPSVRGYNFVNDAPHTTPITRGVIVICSQTYKTPSVVPPTSALPSSTNLIAVTFCRSIERCGSQVPWSQR